MHAVDILIQLQPHLSNCCTLVGECLTGTPAHWRLQYSLLVKAVNEQSTILYKQLIQRHYRPAQRLRQQDRLKQINSWWATRRLR